VRHYLDILESTFMVRVLPPYSANLGKRLVKSPKVYFATAGYSMPCSTSRTTKRYWAIGAGRVVGGVVIEQIWSQAPLGSRPYFYRTASGNEIDLLLELPGGQRAP
jgi:predicted AAA+ superfamily ATPase